MSAEQEYNSSLRSVVNIFILFHMERPVSSQSKNIFRVCYPVHFVVNILFVDKRKSVATKCLIFL